MKWFFAFCILLLPLFSASAKADDFDMQAFGQMPVLQDGRIKPLDSLARVELKRISGSGSFSNLSAIAWLAHVFFEPADAMQQRIFRLNAPQTSQMLGLPLHADHRYSFEELAGVMRAHKDYIEGLSRKEKSALSQDETEAVRVFTVTNDFAELMGTFSLLLPLQHMEEARTRLNFTKEEPLTFFDLQKHRQALAAMLEGRQNKPLQTHPAGEYSLAEIVSRLTLQEAVEQDNTLVRIIPPSWGGDVWLSPWAVLATSSGSPQNAELFREWRDAATAYHKHDVFAWDTVTQKLLAESHSLMDPGLVWRAGLEYDYNRFNLLAMAAALYALGISAVTLSTRALGVLYIGRACLLLGLVLHAAALVMRMVILMRPPVSTLYESLIFVSFVVMATSNWLGWRRQHLSGMLIGAFTSLMLLLASWVFAGDNDTLGVLVAVLNTNFWLATHVVCITTGYATALITGGIAHLYLVRRAWMKTPEETLMPLAKLLHRCSLIALLFTAVGTMLGGIWADQSWGRFWGWDPKENGALLIVLWLVWLLHGRVARQLSAFSFAAWMALIDVVVALAWIGVNLLSVGLHSYGFTDAAATGLVSFCAVEFAFVAATAVKYKVTKSISAG